MTVHPALPAVYVTLSCVGIAFAIACLIFNFVYRNAKYVCIDTIYICNTVHSYNYMVLELDRTDRFMWY